MDQFPDAPRPSSRETVVRSRLLPRISFRSLLIFNGLAAVMIATIYAADQGGAYARAATAALIFLVTLILVQSIAFLASWSVSFLPKVMGIALIVVSGLVLVMHLIGSQVTPYLSGWTGVLNLQLVGWFLILYPFNDASSSRTENPFAEGQLPPQILAPRNQVDE